jgi:hypothetical protein
MLLNIFVCEIEFIIQRTVYFFQHSDILKKLFVMEARSVPIQFKVNKGDPLMYVRAVAVYCDPDSSNKPVLRCPNHLRPEEPLNSGIVIISLEILASTIFDQFFRLRVRRPRYSLQQQLCLLRD